MTDNPESQSPQQPEPPGGLSVPPPLLVAPPIVAAPPPEGTSPALVSMILGIICCCTFCFCYGIPSIVCGILALVFANKYSEQLAAGTGNVALAGQAKTGRTCAIVGLCLVAGFWLIGIIAVIVMAANGAFNNP